jgi:hypothetical protein
MPSRNSHQSLAAIHKRCSTMERNTTKKNAAIKSVPCPLELCIKPGIVMGVFSLRAYEVYGHRALVPRLTCRDSRRKVGLPPAQYSRTLRCFAECWLRDFDLTSRALEKPRPMRVRGVHGAGTVGAEPTSCDRCVTQFCARLLTFKLGHCGSRSCDCPIQTTTLFCRSVQ